MDKGQQTRLRILDEAMAFVAQNGLARVSIGEMAKRLSMSRTGVISHFANKADMQIAILKHCEQVFKSQVVIPSMSNEPLEHLTNYFRCWMNWVYKYKNQPQMTCPFVKAIAEFQDRAECEVKRCISDQQKRNLLFIGSLVQKNIDTGVFAPSVDVYHFSLASYGCYLAHNINKNLLGSSDADLMFTQQIDALIQQSLSKD